MSYTIADDMIPESLEHYDIVIEDAVFVENQVTVVGAAASIPSVKSGNISIQIYDNDCKLAFTTFVFSEQ